MSKLRLNRLREKNELWGGGMLLLNQMTTHSESNKIGMPKLCRAKMEKGKI